MAGFNYELGRSNNMVAAEDRGMITIGRWAKRHGVSAAAAQEIIRPTEAHHTGTGRRGKSRLTFVIASEIEPTAGQLSAMREFDRAAKSAKESAAVIYEHCARRYITWPTTRGARRVPTEHVEGPGTLAVFADGRLEWNGLAGTEKKSGLIVAREGRLIYHANVNLAFDSLETIAKRICQ